MSPDLLWFCVGAGEHLRLCPQDYTCCSSQMEETLALQSERDFLKGIEDTSQFLLTTFTQRHRKFDGETLTQWHVQLGSTVNENYKWFNIGCEKQSSLKPRKVLLKKTGRRLTPSFIPLH